MYLFNGTRLKRGQRVLIDVHPDPGVKKFIFAGCILLIRKTEKG